MAYRSKPCFVEVTPTHFGTLTQELWCAEANGAPASECFATYTKFTAKDQAEKVTAYQGLLGKAEALAIMAANPDAVNRDELTPVMLAAFEELRSRVAERAGHI